MFKTTTSVLILACIFSSVMSLEYDYSDQANWGGDCQTGMYQSPIDIKSSDVKMCPNPGYEKFTIECEEFVEDFVTDNAGIENIGNIYIFYYYEELKMYEAYKATGIYWYTTSEHLINGKSYDAEAEITFAGVEWFQIPPHARGIYADTDLSGFTDISDDSSMRFLFYLDESEGATDFYSGVRVDGETKYWNFNNMFGCAFDQYFYIYQGSSTVPFAGEQCKEIIWNYVSRKPLPITADTLAMIKSHIAYDENTNHRELHDIGDNRYVAITGRPCHAEEL